MLMTYYAINNEKINLSKTAIFKIYGVSRSGYYSWLERYLDKNKTIEKKELEESDIMDKFKQIIKRVGHVPGKRTFRTHMFRDFGMTISLGKCKRIMNKMNLVPTLPKKDAYKGQVTYNHECAACQNHVDQKFKIAPRTVILTDITYLYYGLDRKLCYLCCFKDAYTAEILGHAISNKMNVTLIENAYKIMMDAHEKEFKKDSKVYIHSDQGSQYLSTSFKELLSDDGFIQSTSARGNSQDNAPMESFFGRLKTSLLDILALVPNFYQVCNMVSNFLYSYNNEQYQYNLAGLTPHEFYLYSTTGIYPLDTYFGVDKGELNSIEELVETRLKIAREKQDKIKEANRKKREERAKLNDPLKIVVRDKNLILKEIAKWTMIKDKASNQISKLNNLLFNINNAYEFVSNATDDVLDSLTMPSSWQNYKELSYVNHMNSFF